MTIVLRASIHLVSVNVGIGAGWLAYDKKRWLWELSHASWPPSFKNTCHHMHGFTKGADTKMSPACRVLCPPPQENSDLRDGSVPVLTPETLPDFQLRALEFFGVKRPWMAIPPAFLWAVCIGSHVPDWAILENRSQHIFTLWLTNWDLYSQRREEIPKKAGMNVIAPFMG